MCYASKIIAASFPFQILSKVAGPEEMKWPSKELYTYNVRDGDSFILDEKVSLGKLKTRNLSFTSSQYSPTRPMNHSRSGKYKLLRFYNNFIYCYLTKWSSLGILLFSSPKAGKTYDLNILTISCCVLRLISFTAILQNGLV